MGQIITVNFRDVYKREFTNGPYAYICNINVEVGDLVLVETKFGYSLAQVSKLNQKLTKGDINDLKYVIKVVMTVGEQLKEELNGQN